MTTPKKGSLHLIEKAETQLGLISNERQIRLKEVHHSEPLKTSQLMELLLETLQV